MFKLNVKKEQVFVNFLQNKLSKGKKKVNGGRNNQGFITMKHQGGQCKRNIRIINSKYLLWNIYGIVLKFIYEANRNAPLMLVCYLNGVLSYHIAVKDIKLGDLCFVGDFKSNLVFVKNWTTKFSSLFEGNMIHNVELVPLNGTKLIRSAGTAGQLLKIDKKKEQVLVRLPSKEERLLSISSVCSLGQNANLNHFLLSIDKAGRNRHLGVRPVVRGVAMNSVDHPHGGGRGKTSGAGGFRSQVTFKGKVAKTQPTRNKNKNSIFIAKARKKC